MVVDKDTGKSFLKYRCLKIGQARHLVIRISIFLFPKPFLLGRRKA